jgi:hypothetical protein
MKNIFLKTLFCSLCFYISVNAKAQEEVKGIKQIFDITMDDLGNAAVEVTMKLNASQWDMYKKNIGNNTSVIKRSMETALPKYYLSNFNYSEDQMERTYKIKFNLAGLTTVNGNGKWEGKLDSKDPDITKLSDREFVMASNMMMNGTLFQVTEKIHLPPDAEGAKIEKDSFGKAVLTYSTGGGMMSKATLFIGIALMLAGGGLFFKNRQSSKSKLRVINKEEAIAS